MPLFLAPIMKEVKIVRISTDDKIKKHLESLGITIDARISILSQNNGSTILLVKNGRLALDRNLSTKIFVA